MSILDISTKLEKALTDLQAKKKSVDDAQLALNKASQAYALASEQIEGYRQELFKRVNEQLGTSGVEPPRANVTQST